MDTVTTQATTLGTPASPKWDADWLAEVDRIETELGRRICGAHTPAWTPCKLGSTHPNGRCRFHGGAPGIGAPDGNRNAWVHGLYSRRLQQCGDHCPLWNHCPMAGRDVLDLAPSERPHCVYEQEEFETTLTLIARSAVATKQSLPGESAHLSAHSFSESNSSNKSEPSDSLLRNSAPPRDLGLVQRNVALFQVMLSRAQAALGIARLTDDTRARTLNYHMQSTRMSALVQAQLHIARELRQWLKLLPGFDPKSWRRLPACESPTHSDDAPKHTGLPMRMLKVLEETEGFLETALGLPPGEKSAFSPRLPKRTPPNAGPAPA